MPDEQDSNGQKEEARCGGHRGDRQGTPSASSADDEGCARGQDGNEEDAVGEGCSRRRGRLECDPSQYSKDDDAQEDENAIAAFRHSAFARMGGLRERRSAGGGRPGYRARSSTTLQTLPEVSNANSLDGQLQRHVGRLSDQTPGTP